MAKHWVKCYYCDETFDTSSTPFVAINAKRYAHKSCHEKKLANESQQEKDKRTLHEYIKELFHFTEIPLKITKQIQTYAFDPQYRYTYSGMYKTLKYFYEIQGNSIDKANGGIGIIPYVYAQAFEYWKAIWEAQQLNEGVDLRKYILPSREIHLPPPQREPMVRTRKLFAFLDDDDNNEEEGA